MSANEFQRQIRSICLQYASLEGKRINTFGLGLGGKRVTRNPFEILGIKGE